MKKIYLYYLSTLIFLVFSLISKAQYQTAKNSEFNTIRTFIPSTPEMSLYQRYGDIPVNHNTGVANVAIPLAEIKLKNFSWPISISYHTGGNKVADFASTVGLGWVLNAGGYLSGKGLNGGPEAVKRRLNLDRIYVPFYNGVCDDPIYQNESDIGIADNLLVPGRLYRPDISYFNSPVLNLKGILGDDWFYTLPISNTRFKRETVGGKTTLTITDAKGNKYIMELQGDKVATNACGMPAEMNTSWALTKIETYDGEYLLFEYDKVLYTYQDLNYETKQTINTNDCQRCQVDIAINNKNCVMQNTVDEFVIKSITSSNGQKVLFKYSSRTDHPLNRKLDAVIVQDYLGTQYENKAWYTFGYSYFGNAASNNLRLKLDNVKNIITQNNHEIHQFDYFAGEIPTRLSKNIDFGGYYNGFAGEFNTTLIPSQSYRQSDFESTKIGMLSKITYPTGGSSTFTYELNAGNWGGLRIKELIDYAATGIKAKKRSYSYLGGTTNTGSYVSNDLQYFFGHGSKGMVEPDLPLSALELITCTVFTEQSVPVFGFVQGFIQEPLGYSWVEERFDNYENNVVADFGKTIYKYNTLFNHKNRNNLFAFNPVLTEKEIYLGTTNQLVQKEENYYSVNDEVIVNDLNFWDEPVNSRDYRVWVKRLELTRDAMSHLIEGTIPSYRCYGKDYLQIDTRFDLPALYLDSNIVRQYHNGQEIATKKQYEFDKTQGELEPFQVMSTSSDGSVITQTTKYTTSNLNTLGYNTAEQLANTALKDANVVAPLYTLQKNGTTNTSQSQIYYNLFAGKALPVKEKIILGSNNESRQIEVTAYNNKGDVTETLTQGLKYKAFRYSDKGELTATFENAKFAETAYTSFDNVGETGFNYNNAGISSAEAYSGTSSFTLSGNQIIKNNLITGSKYVIRLFQKSANIIISGANVLESAVEPLANGWSLYHAKVQASANAITINGSGFIDDLCFYPSSSNANTFVYSTVFQRTVASTDISGKTGFFTYHPDGKLWQVKDQKNNIIKQYCYNYAGQTIDCNTAPQAYSLPVYARIEITNLTYNYPGGLSNNNVEVYGDVAIKLYEDANCTIPIVANGNQQIHVETVLSIDNGFGPAYYPSTTMYVVTAGTSQANMGNRLLRRDEEIYDPWLGFGTITYSRSEFTVVSTSGTTYIPQATIGNLY